MKQDLSNKRKDYSLKFINFSELPENPYEFFTYWFENALNSEKIREAYAMNLSTIEGDGFPRSRVVLLKEYNLDGFIFYTNYESQKGRAIENNSHVCLSFFWDELEQQVIIKGLAEKVSLEMSEAYFHRRPLLSQIGALVSKQSSVIDFKKNLEEEVKTLEDKYHGKDVPKPKYWGGYLVKPIEIEFWQGRPSRLHDRVRYVLEKENWKLERLSP